MHLGACPVATSRLGADRAAVVCPVQILQRQIQNDGSVDGLIVGLGCFFIILIRFTEAGKATPL